MVRAFLDANNVFPSVHPSHVNGLGFSPANPRVLYLGALPGLGLWKSLDGGNTWGNGPIGKTLYGSFDGNAPILDGDGKPMLNPWTTKNNAYDDPRANWSMAVDPTNADVLYAMCNFSGPQGLYKSTDGGDTWRYVMTPEHNKAMTPDFYSVTIDPAPGNNQHILATFHSGWNFTGNAGIAESPNGGKDWVLWAPKSLQGKIPDFDNTGSRQTTIHYTLPDAGAGHNVFFLGKKDNGDPDTEGKYWIWATQGAGFFRTIDGGMTWNPVVSVGSETFSMMHGAGGMYRATNGVLYMGANRYLLRSTDNGASWANAGVTSTQDGYNDVIGDGTFLYAIPANAPMNGSGKSSYYVSLETDGQSWVKYNDQTFESGAMHFAFDAANGVIFSSNWSAGLWRLKLR